MWRAGIGSSSSRSAPSPGGSLSPSMDHPQGRSSSEDDRSAASSTMSRPIEPIPRDAWHRRRDRGHREGGPNPRTIWSAAVSYRWSTDRPGQVASPVRMGPRLLKKALSRSQGLSTRRLAVFPLNSINGLQSSRLARRAPNRPLGGPLDLFQQSRPDMNISAGSWPKGCSARSWAGCRLRAAVAGRSGPVTQAIRTRRAPCPAPSPTSGSPPPSRPPTTSSARSERRASLCSPGAW